MENNDLLIGYVYQSDNSYKEYFFKDTPDNIANFIMNHQYNKVIITNLMDTFIVSSVVGGFIDQCFNQNYLIKQLLPKIIPLQNDNSLISEIDYFKLNEDLEFIDV